MTPLLPALVLGSLCILTAGQQLDSVSLFRVGNNTICPSDVVTLECSVQGDAIEWYCADGNSRILVCPAENIFPLECDERVYQFYDCEKNGSVIKSSLFFNTTTENTTITCRNGVNISQTKTISITFEDPPPPIIVLDDQVYDINNTHAVNISWHVPANVQQPTYKVYVTPVAQEQTSPFVTQQMNTILKLAVNTTYHITIKTTTCDGNLESSESQPLTVALNGPAGVTWCSVTPTHENRDWSVQWSPLPDSQNISSGVNLPLLSYNLTYAVEGTPDFQLLQPENCDAVCSLNINSTSTNIFVLGLNAVGPGRKEPCNLDVSKNGTDNGSKMEGTGIIGIVIASTVVGTVLVLFVAGITCFIVIIYVQKNNQEDGKNVELVRIADTNEEEDGKKREVAVTNGRKTSCASGKDRKFEVLTPRGLCVTKNYVFASNIKRSNKDSRANVQEESDVPEDSVVVFEKETGSKAHIFLDRMFLPRGIAVDTDGYIYIVDFGNHRILKFDKEYRRIRTDQQNVTLEYPFGICIVGDRIYITDKDHHCVQVFSLNLQWLSSFQTFATQSPCCCSAGDIQTLYSPVGIAFDSIEKLFYVVDQGNNSINKFDKGYKYIRRIKNVRNEKKSLALNKMRGIAISSQRRLVFVTEPLKNRILCFTTNEVLVSMNVQWNNRKFYNPQVLALDPEDSYLYVGDDSGQLHKIDLDALTKE